MRILFLSHFIPHPPIDGASLRNYNIVRELARTHDVHLLTFTQRNRHADRRRIEQSREILREYCRDVSIVNVPTDMSRLGWYALLGLNLASAAPYSVWRFRSRAMAAALNRQLDSHTFDVVHVDTIGLLRYAEMLRGLPVVLNHHNVESSLFLRRAATERNPLTRAYLGLQGRKLRNAERSALRRLDGHIAVSDRDRNELLDHQPGANIAVIPNGVSTDFFKPIDTEIEANSLVFTGSMSWAPNSDAMILFAERIWPLIKREIPGAVMNLIGSHPPPEVVRLGARDRQFRVLGFLDDVRPVVARSAAYVVPIRVGGGTRLKILDAMAMGKAIVSHSIGAEGIGVTDGRDILIADEPELFARRVVDLLRDAGQRQALGAEARQTVLEHYTWSMIIPRLEHFYSEVAAARRR